jgi:alpha-beta hydrolase superfamily lysophospholipase
MDTSLTIETDDGLTLDARLQTQTTSHGAVVVAHGFSASKDHPNVKAVADAIFDAGFDVVTYDCRGHGESGGRCTLGDLEQHDVAAAVKLAATASDRIALVGASMGGIAVLRYAAVDPSLVAVVTVSSPAVWKLPRSPQGLLAAALTRTRPGRWISASRLGVRLAPSWTAPEPPVDLVARLTVPLAIIHGSCDRFIASDQARQLARAASGPCRLDLVTGMGHAYEPVAIPAILNALEWGFGLVDKTAEPAGVS